MREVRVKLPDDTNDTVVIRVYEGACPACAQGDQAHSSVATFGLSNPNNVYDCTQVFHWCSCGHKWIDGVERPIKKEEIENE